MEIITRMRNKIKDLSEKRVVQDACKIGCVMLLMIISFIFGKLSSEGGEKGSLMPVAIYLPNGDLYSKNKTPESPLSAYILGGATDAYRVINGPTSDERLQIVENSPEYTQMMASHTSSSGTGDTTREGIFGSKNGHTYYTVGCTAGNRVKPENRVYFSSETDAGDKGYSKSKLCK